MYMHIVILYKGLHWCGVWVLAYHNRIIYEKANRASSFDKDRKSSLGFDVYLLVLQ